MKAGEGEGSGEGEACSAGDEDPAHPATRQAPANSAEARRRRTRGVLRAMRTHPRRTEPGGASLLGEAP